MTTKNRSKKKIKNQLIYCTCDHQKVMKKNKKRKAIKILASNNLLTKLPVFLAQIKAGINSDKLKREVRRIVHLLYQHKKITQALNNNLIKLL